MELSCPVSAEYVNENVVRVIAFSVAAVGICCMITSNYWAMLFLVIDFFTRAFTSGRFSLLKTIGSKLVHLFSFKLKPTDLAPKKFAALLGFTFCCTITAAFLLNSKTAALVLTAVLIIFALLESLCAICIGCYVYTIWSKLKRR